MDITSIAIGTFIYIIIPKLLDNFKKSVILITQMVHSSNTKRNTDEKLQGLQVL